LKNRLTRIKKARRENGVLFLFLLGNKKSNYGRLEFVVPEFAGREFEFIIVLPFLIILPFIEFPLIEFPPIVFPPIELPDIVLPPIEFPPIELPDIVLPPIEFPPIVLPPIELPEFIFVIFEFILLALPLALLLAASPHDIPNELIANSAERAKVFFILFIFSCLLLKD
jgi:hypothetical protein